MSNPLSGCVITWLGLLHMDNLAVLWDKILMFNLKNHGCALEMINTKPRKGAQNQNNSYTLSFVIQMLQTIWLADRAVCKRISKGWQSMWNKTIGKPTFGRCFHFSHLFPLYFGVFIWYVSRLCKPVAFIISYLNCVTAFCLQQAPFIVAIWFEVWFSHILGLKQASICAINAQLH